MVSQCHVIQPRRLKDFLQDQNLPFPHHRKSTISVLIHAVKSSSILPRSISRRFSNKSKSSSCQPQPTVARSTSVTVKDILRWRSFRDVVDTQTNSVPQPTDLMVESPSRRTITTSSDGTPRSSWCDSDFTVGDSPVWCRGFTSDLKISSKKNFHINVAGRDQNTENPKDQIVHEEVEDEQSSPVSVLDFTQQHEETFFSFHQSLANMERQNIMFKQRIPDFENLIEVEDCCLMNKTIELYDVESLETEEKVIQLMDHVKMTSSIEEWDVIKDCMLLDFFRDELIMNKGEKNRGQIESKVLRMANSWVRGEDDGSLEWELEGTREVCVREMWKNKNWKDFEEEQQEIGIEIEKMMLNHLLDELSMDLLNV